MGAAAEAAALARTHREEAGKAQRAAGAAAAGALQPSAAAPADAAGGAAAPDADADDTLDEDTPLDASAAAADADFTERARYIPLRLNLKERTRLRLLEAALTVSDYTDKVDVISYSKSKTQRITKQLQEICAILCGLVVALDYKTGQELLADKDFAQNAGFFQAVFEIGRRHKVMNPEKMRSEYGKLVYLLQDSQLPDVQALLEFQIVTPLKARTRAQRACVDASDRVHALTLRCVCSADGAFVFGERELPGDAERPADGGGGERDRRGRAAADGGCEGHPGEGACARGTEQEVRAAGRRHAGGSADVSVQHRRQRGLPALQPRPRGPVS